MTSWSQVSPYFHLVVWSFNFALLTVWLWELKARNVTLKNIPAAFVLMTLSLALALLNSCVFLFIGGTHELDIGGESTRQWMCAFCGTLAIFGLYLVRVSVWAFFVVRGSLVTSFHRRLNQIAGATPYVLSAHTCLFAALCVLFVDVEKGQHSHHSQMCRVRDFPLWLLFVGPMAGDLFYGVGFFVIFYKTMKTTLLETMKSMPMRDRILTKRHLRRNLVLFVMQLLSAIGAYVLIVAMNFSFASFELAEMNAAITNVCLFALFQGRVKVYSCCSRVFCPELYGNLLRHDEVQRELRGDEAKKRRKAIDAFRQKEKDKEMSRISYVISVDDSETIDETISKLRSSSLPILGNDRVFCNRWNRGNSAVRKLPAVVTAHALASAIGDTPPFQVDKNGSPTASSEMSMSSDTSKSKPTTLAVPMTAFGKVPESGRVRVASVLTKASKVLGVSEQRMLRHMTSQSANVSDLVSELQKESKRGTTEELPYIPASLPLPKRSVLQTSPSIAEESSSYGYFDDSSSEELPLVKGKRTSDLKPAHSVMDACVKRKSKLSLAERISVTTSLPVRKERMQKKGPSDFESDSDGSDAMPYDTTSTATRLKSISSFSCKQLFPKMQSMEGKSTSESGSHSLADYSDADETEALALMCCASATLSGESTLMRASNGSTRSLAKTMSVDTGKRLVGAYIE